MAALTGQSFLNLLSGILARANMTGTALAYYSFYPTSGQSEYLFNNLLPTGATYAQKISSVQMTNLGSGYVTGETATVTFSDIYGGNYASGTAIMQNVTDTTGTIGNGLKRVYKFGGMTGTNLVKNYNFSSGATGWFYSGTSGQMPSSKSGEFSFSGGYLLISGGNVFPSYKLIAMKPNSGQFVLTGACWYTISIDIVSGATGALGGTYSFSLESGGGTIYHAWEPPIISKNFSGTGNIRFGGYLPSGVGFIPVLAFYSFVSPYVIGNITICTGDFGRDEILRNPQESFILTPALESPIYVTPERNVWMHLYSGLDYDISGVSLGQSTARCSSTTVDQPIATALINEQLPTYSMSFWLYFSGTKRLDSSIIELAEWTNMKLRIVDGYYALYIPSSDTTIRSIVPYQTGGGNPWHNIQIFTTPF